MVLLHLFWSFRIHCHCMEKSEYLKKLPLVHHPQFSILPYLLFMMCHCDWTVLNLCCSDINLCAVICKCSSAGAHCRLSQVQADFNFPLLHSSELHHGLLIYGLIFSCMNDSRALRIKLLSALWIKSHAPSLHGKICQFSFDSSINTRSSSL